MSDLPAQLSEYRDAFAQCARTARRIWQEASPGTLIIPPEPAAWSAAQCLAHLNATAGPLVDAMESRIFTAQRHGPYGTPPFEYAWYERLFIATVDPNNAWRIPAPPMTRPVPQPDPNAVLNSFCDLQERLAVCVARSARLDLSRVRVASPVIPLFAMSVGAWFVVTINHQQRHLQQARRALAAVS